MEIEITIRGEPEEIEEQFGLPITRLGESNGESSSGGSELSEEEELIMQTVRDNPGSALRTIHKEAAKRNNSPWEFTGEWDEDRTVVQSILRDLRRDDFVRLDERSYYPSEHEAVIDQDENE